MEIKMSHKIYKYPIPVKETFTLDLPRDAEIIRVDDVDGHFWLWAIVDTDPNAQMVTRYFENYKTGQEFKTNPRNLKYLGMVKMFIMQELALYVFENISTVRPFTEKAPVLAPGVGRPMNKEERDAMDRAFIKSIEEIDPGYLDQGTNE